MRGNGGAFCCASFKQAACRPLLLLPAAVQLTAPTAAEGCGVVTGSASDCPAFRECMLKCTIIVSTVLCPDVPTGNLRLPTHLPIVSCHGASPGHMHGTRVCVLGGHAGMCLTAVRLYVCSQQLSICGLWWPWLRPLCFTSGSGLRTHAAAAAAVAGTDVQVSSYGDGNVCLLLHSVIRDRHPTPMSVCVCACCL